ncbi:hypothetical protein ACQ4M3_27130 [Leptolyngbya sp. AN03gr2]|uniref:hypothetical protein n=1 Tax=unclassified Leptolyngbya TaxID=2650499 RepID=UPI003D31C610
MSRPENRRVVLELDANHPNFLTGLELWIQLGLLSDRQILKLSQQYLTSVLPEIAVARSTTDFISPVEPALPSPAPPPTPRQPNVLEQIARSFQQELSVVWLLALGVFLVIISSAVLAASQWQNVSSIGQYLVLLGYTMSFWGVSFWTGRQARLRLTASTLQTLALLLVPINFWAIDRFLLQSIQSISLVTALIAAMMLSGMAIAVFRQRFSSSALITSALVSYLGLSYLQCGWSFANVPLLATYLGTITAFITVRPTTAFVRLVFPIVAIVLLFFRAIFIAGIDIAQLGLAFGIVGWLVARVAQQHSLALLWAISAGLLGFGWLVSVGTIVWQALIVSSLGLLFWWKLLQRYWRQFDVIALLVVGLQSIWLIWRLVPDSLQSQVVNITTTLTQAQTVPFTLLGIVLFPYLIGILVIANWLERNEKFELARFTESIALLFGIGLTAISSFAPATRTLTLLASTVTLGRFTQQKHNPIQLVYGTHLVGLMTLVAATDWRFSNLEQSTWATIFLGIAIAEWSFSLFRDRIWTQSAWYFGFGVATLSYILFLEPSPKFAIVWILVPAFLTGIAIRDQSRRTDASWTSTIGLFMVQALAIQHRETGLLSLSLATVLMLVNTRCLARIELAYLTFGFGFSAIGWWIWHWFPGFTVESWLLVGAIALTILWQFYRWGQSHRSNFITLFAQAADRWAIGWSAIVLVSLSLRTVQIYETSVLPNVLTMIAAGLTTSALVFRTWQASSTLTFIGIGIGLELLIAEGLAWFEPSLARLCVANVVLGVIVQLFGELRQRRNSSEPLSIEWHILPIAYGIFALMLRSQLFTAWTGLVSLGVAWIAIAIGKRRSEYQPLTYAGVIGTSIAAYELVLYQVRTLPMSDQLMAIATLGAVLMLLYRIPRSRMLRALNLSVEDIRPLAHLHWAISSIFLSVAALLTLLMPDSSGILALVGFTTGMVLSLYAIWQARHRPVQLATEAWLYAGLLEAAGLMWYLSTKPWFSGFFSGVVRPYAAAISAIAAFVLFALPWDRLGWARQPWQRVALALPLLVLAGTAGIVHPVSLIVIAVFYSLVASIQREVRWTYLSVGLLNWLVFDQLHQLNVESLFWQVLPIGLSILYFAQIEPTFVQQRSSRHYVRLCGAGLICATALLTQENYGILPGIVSLIVIFAGLGLRVRAFLYVGTLVFLLNAINQLIVFIALYSLLKWIIGLCLGILLISIAANFETRRDQMTALMQNWLTELEDWD